MAFAGLRDQIKTICPSWLQDGVGERLMYALGLAADAILDKLTRAIDARCPGRTTDDGAIAALCNDRQIVRGPNESASAIGSRLQSAFDSWRMAGTETGLLTQLLGYASPYQITATVVANSYFPYGLSAGNRIPIKQASMWGTLSQIGLSATHAQSVPGNWSWDDSTSVLGSWGTYYDTSAYQFRIVSSSTWVILFSVSPNQFVQRTTVAWGSLPGNIGARYSQIVGGVYVDAGGTHTGSTWSADSGAPPAGSRYSQLSTLKYYGLTYVGNSYGYGALPGSWGFAQTPDYFTTLRGIIKQWKRAGNNVRNVVIAFSASIFQPGLGAGGGYNPDGYFGRWSKVSGGAFVASRVLSGGDSEYIDGVF